MRISKLAQAFVATALLVGPGIASAQIVDRDRDGVADSDRGGFDLGWLGLIGLAGLAGLKGRDKLAPPYKANPTPASTVRP